MKCFEVSELRLAFYWVRRYRNDCIYSDRYVVSSIGAGLAVNVRVGIARRNDMLHSVSSMIDWGKTRQLPAGVESESVIYYEGQTWQMLEEGYCIIVAYSDIHGNRYLQYFQYFSMTFDEQDNVLQSTVNDSITRIGIP